MTIPRHPMQANPSIIHDNPAPPNAGQQMSLFLVVRLVGVRGVARTGEVFRVHADIEQVGVRIVLKYEYTSNTQQHHLTQCAHGEEV